MPAKARKTVSRKPTSQKTEKFDLRLSQQENAVIKQAAVLLSTTPTNFIRQQAVVAAEAVVHEQTRFVVSDEQWKKIEHALNAPAKILPNLKKQLSQPDEWD